MKPGSSTSGAAIPLALVSAAAIALQLALIRAISVASFHHVVYVTISVALLGFGASATVLAVVKTANPPRIGLIALSLCAVGCAWSYRLATTLPLNIHYLLFDPAQLVWLTLYAGFLFIPFFGAGLFIGMVLTFNARDAGRLYATNLVASGAGGIAGVLLPFVIPPERLPGAVSIAATAALIVFVIYSRKRENRTIVHSVRRGALVTAVLIAVVTSVVLPPSRTLDRHKAEAHMERLAEQGDAAVVSDRYGPRGRVTIYDAPSFHHTLFAAPLAPLPPPQLGVFVDGNLAGSVLRVGSMRDTEVLDAVPQALPYRLFTSPRVLLLGETTGTNVWLALRNGARSIVVVQSNPTLVAALTHLPAQWGAPLALPNVSVHTTEPRLFLNQESDTFDLIHLVSAEGMPAGAGGVGSLREEHLLTEEAMARALELLAPGGMIAVTRGTQSPPRDNVKIFALLAAAVKRSGGIPGRQILQARNYLASTTVAAAGPLTPTQITSLRDGAADLSMDVDYFPGIGPADLTHINRLPPGITGYTDAALEILASLESDVDFTGDIYDLRPPTDDRPYFHSFFRLRSLSTYFERWGREWVHHVELGLAVVAATLLVVLVLGALLIIAPVLLTRRRRRQAGSEGGRQTGWTIAHFGLIGSGFMLLEMLFIQRLARYLGEVTLTAAAVLTGILVWAGVGSAVQARVSLPPLKRIMAAGVAVSAIVILYSLGLDWVMRMVESAPAAVRFMTALFALGPVSFFMGWHFAAGLDHLRIRGPLLLPAAWGTNAITSVVSAPTAAILSAVYGYTAVSVVAAGCYGLVALLAAIGHFRETQRFPL